MKNSKKVERLIIWDGEDSPLTNAAKKLKAQKRDQKIILIPSKWEHDNKMSVLLKENTEKFHIDCEVPTKINGKTDKILLGLNTDGIQDTKTKDNKNSEYIMGERSVLISSIHFYLNLKYKNIYFNPLRFPGDSGTILYPHDQRNYLQKAGFQVLLALNTNDRIYVKKGITYARTFFVGIDMPFAIDHKKKYGLPYMPNRFLKLMPKMQYQVITVLKNKVFRNSFLSPESSQIPKEIDPKTKLYKISLKSSRLAGTDVCEIGIMSTKKTQYALSLVRTLGMLNHPDSLYYHIENLMRQMK